MPNFQRLTHVVLTGLSLHAGLLAQAPTVFDSGGVVNLVGATFGKTLVTNGTVLSCTSCTFNGDVRLNNGGLGGVAVTVNGDIHADGGVVSPFLGSSTVNGNVVVENCTVAQINPGTPLLGMLGTTITGNLTYRNATLPGITFVSICTIGGDLKFQDCLITTSLGFQSINMQRNNVSGSVFVQRNRYRDEPASGRYLTLGGNVCGGRFRVQDNVMLGTMQGTSGPLVFVNGTVAGGAIFVQRNDTGTSAVPASFSVLDNTSGGSIRIDENSPAPVVSGNLEDQ